MFSYAIKETLVCRIMQDFPRARHVAIHCLEKPLGIDLETLYGKSSPVVKSIDRQSPAL